jgi:archaellum component FlaF (FlaF/FlaG flagellin family)
LLSTMAKKILFPVLLICSVLISVAQTSVRKMVINPLTPDINTISHKLGDRVIQIKTYQYGSAKNIVYINLHDDEITSVNAAKRLLQIESGVLIKIDNFKTRNIKFKLAGKYYTFDPNRMFSRIGIIQTLTMFGRVSIQAVDEVDKFAKRILDLIPQNPRCIIALHNNSNGKFSINSFLPGNLREHDAKDLSINKDEDPDDIFLTTDSVLFRKLADDQYNSIYQDNENAKKDGSLSIYCGEKGIRYVNCETEHGHDIQYQQMIQLVSRHAQEKDEEPVSEVIAYTYRLSTSTVTAAPKNNTEIMFGEKKVGLIRSVATDSSWATVGKLEITKDFPLYSNMDLLFFPSPASSPRFEVRIDPTREKELLDPSKTVVKIRAAN